MINTLPTVGATIVDKPKTLLRDVKLNCQPVGYGVYVRNDLVARRDIENAVVMRNGDDKDMNRA